MLANWIIRASAVTAFFIVFCIGLVVSREQEDIKNMALWGQCTADQVARSTKAGKS